MGKGAACPHPGFLTPKTAETSCTLDLGVAAIAARRFRQFGAGTALQRVSDAQPAAIKM